MKIDFIQIIFGSIMLIIEILLSPFIGIYQMFHSIYESFMSFLSYVKMGAYPSDFKELRDRVGELEYKYKVYLSKSKKSKKSKKK